MTGKTFNCKNCNKKSMRLKSKVINGKLTCVICINAFVVKSFSADKTNLKFEIKEYLLSKTEMFLELAAKILFGGLPVGYKQASSIKKNCQNKKLAYYNNSTAKWSYHLTGVFTIKSIWLCKDCHSQLMNQLE